MVFLVAPLFDGCAKNLLLYARIQVTEAKDVRVHFFDVLLDQKTAVAPVDYALGQ